MKKYKNLLYSLFGLMLFGCPSTNNNEYTLLSCSTYEKSNEYASKVEENISNFPKNCSGSFAVSDSDFKPPVGCDAVKCKKPACRI
ncbi:MAG: hypothetical protein ACOCWM_01470 [Cyclobacteriaceae bacterium]